MSEYQMPPPNKVNSPQPGNGDEETIDLLELFYALLSKWKQLAAATVACALIAAIGVLFFCDAQVSGVVYHLRHQPERLGHQHVRSPDRHGPDR